MIKKLLENCTICSRCSLKSPHQLMGDLLEEMWTRVRVFKNVGVDVAGPFLGKFSNEPFKTFSFVFVCISFRACQKYHMLSMTEAPCLAALKLFFARREKVSSFFSDKAPSFLTVRETLSIQEETDFYFHQISFQTSVNYLGNRMAGNSHSCTTLLWPLGVCD